MLGIAYNDATEVPGVAGGIRSCWDLKNAEKFADIFLWPASSW